MGKEEFFLKFVLAISMIAASVIFAVLQIIIRLLEKEMPRYYKMALFLSQVLLIIGFLLLIFNL